MLEGQARHQRSGWMNPLRGPTDLRGAKGAQKTALLTQRTQRYLCSTCISPATSDPLSVSKTHRFTLETASELRRALGGPMGQDAPARARVAGWTGWRGSPEGIRVKPHCTRPRLLSARVGDGGSSSAHSRTSTLPSAAAAPPSGPSGLPRTPADRSPFLTQSSDHVTHSPQAPPGTAGQT